MARPKISLPNDYERMIPEYHKGGQIYGEHVARYRAVEDIVRGKKVLDIACGSGYGTAMIAQTAKTVVGVDVSEESIRYAGEYYNRKNVTYLVGDGENIPCKDGEFDVIVTFETVEHIKDYERFIKECKRVLKPDGLLIVSTPNDLEFAEGNHFHLHEFEHNELNQLLTKYFKNITHYYQSTWLMNLIGDRKSMSKEWEQDVRVLQTAPIDPEKYLYFFFLCSNRRINETVQTIAAIGQHWSERGFQIHNNSLQKQIKEQNATIKQMLTTIEALNGEVASMREHLGRINGHILNLPYRLARRAKHFTGRVIDSRKQQPK